MYQQACLNISPVPHGTAAKSEDSMSTIAFQGKILVLDRTIRHFKNLVKRHKNAMNETTEKKPEFLFKSFGFQHPNIYRVIKKSAKHSPFSFQLQSILTASPLSRQLIPFIGMCLSRRITSTTITPEFVFD
jgi:hypothetical protein